MTSPQTITTREFLRNFSQMKKRKKPMVVINHNKPAGVFIPYAEWKKSFSESKRQISVKDIQQFFFSGAKNLSKQVDDIYQ